VSPHPSTFDFGATPAAENQKNLGAGGWYLGRTTRSNLLVTHPVLCRSASRWFISRVLLLSMGGKAIVGGGEGSEIVPAFFCTHACLPAYEAPS